VSQPQFLVGNPCPARSLEVVAQQLQGTVKEREEYIP